MLTAYQKNLPTHSDCDVLVVGAGTAGMLAALAAARLGARVVQLERLPFLGGTSTAVLDTFYGFYTPGARPRKVVGGIADDVITGLRGFAASLERPNTYGAGTGITYHPEYLKVVWETLATSAGVSVLLNAQVVDVDARDGRVESVIVATRAGLRRYRARMFVDASGDADLCHYAGLDYELAGSIEPAQSLTTSFKMVNVDLARRKSISKKEFHDLMSEAADSGRYQLPRREGSDHITPVDHMTATIMTRLPSWRRSPNGVINATHPELLSAAEIEGRLQAIEYIRFLRERVPGYEKAQLASFGVQIGVRETRRVRGRYWLTRDDVLGARQFDDQIALCGAPIEDHNGTADTKWHYLPDGQCVGIPLRTLVPLRASNVLVAGRCFSASHDAHASVRSMGQTMALGQAAGTAAALAARRDASIESVVAADVRDQLRRDGAILE